MPKPPTLAANLRRLRTAAGLKVEELAVKAGVHPATVYNAESGRCDPRLGVARRLAGALGVSLDELASGNERGR